MENIETKQDQRLIFSSLRALLGEVTSSLRSVSVEIRDGIILWQCIFDAEATEDDLELLSSASTEVIADFIAYDLKEIIKRIPYPEKMDFLKNIVYLRHEKNYYKE